ncbi:hypothetical protein N7467_002190 [Penicillium canescens]|nr:hypothetical protein N7467_002190 [Penicillium canescens]
MIETWRFRSWERILRRIHPDRASSSPMNLESGWGKLLSSQDNTPLLRTYRRAVTRVSEHENPRPDLMVRGKRFIRRVFRAPEKFIQHNRTAVGAFILNITYGYNIEPHGEDPFHAHLRPVKYVPEWMQGANFQRIARDHFQTLTKLLESPFAFAKFQMNREDRNCFSYQRFPNKAKTRKSSNGQQ